MQQQRVESVDYVNRVSRERFKPGWIALVAIYLYGRAVALGITRSQCILRRPLLIMGFWAAVAAADATWLLALR